VRALRSLVLPIVVPIFDITARIYDTQGNLLCYQQDLHFVSCVGVIVAPYQIHRNPFGGTRSSWIIIMVCRYVRGTGGGGACCNNYDPDFGLYDHSDAYRARLHTLSQEANIGLTVLPAYDLYLYPPTKQFDHIKCRSPLKTATR
jgi:hypothetical protein